MRANKNSNKEATKYRLGPNHSLDTRRDERVIRPGTTAAVAHDAVPQSRRDAGLRSRICIY